MDNHRKSMTDDEGSDLGTEEPKLYDDHAPELIHYTFGTAWSDVYGTWCGEYLGAYDLGGSATVIAEEVYFSSRFDDKKLDNHE